MSEISRPITSVGKTLDCPHCLAAIRIGNGGDVTLIKAPPEKPKEKPTPKSNMDTYIKNIMLVWRRIFYWVGILGFLVYLVMLLLGYTFTIVPEVK